MSHTWDLNAVPAESDLPPARALPPQLGPYQPLAILGSGGMGRVYLALDVDSGREVALKVLSSQRPEAGQRFAREAELTARLTHPGIVRVHASGQAGTCLYIAYELIEGARPLDVYAEQLSLDERLELMGEVCAAVGSAHAQDIVHRDLKPENVLVDAAGRPRVADFGLASALDLEALTRTGAFLGTPHFMSPQQLTGDVLEGRKPTSDVWALGVMLWKVSSGELPFGGESLTELMAATSRGLRGPLVLPQSCPRALNDALGAICARALAPEPRLRYPDAGALGRDLDRARRGEAPEALLARRRRGRARWVTLTALLLGLIGLASAVVFHLRQAGSVDAAPARETELGRLRASRRSLASLRREAERLSSELKAVQAPGQAQSEAEEFAALAAAAEGDLGPAARLASMSPLVSAVLTLSNPDRPLGSCPEVLAAAGLPQPEWELWQLWAQLDAGTIDAAAARRAARRVAQVVGATKAGESYWLPLRVRLLARGGEFARASELGPAGPLAAAQVALERAAVAIAKGEGGAAAFTAAMISRAGPRLEPAKRRLRALTQDRLLDLLQSAAFEPARQGLRERLRACLLVLTALGGGEEPPRAAWEQLMAKGGLLGVQPGGLGLDFADAFPAAAYVQTHVACGVMIIDLAQGTTFSPEEIRRLLEVAARSWELQRSDSSALLRYLGFCARFGQWERLVALAVSVPRDQIAAGALVEFDFRHAIALTRTGQLAAGIRLLAQVSDSDHPHWSTTALGELTDCLLRTGRTEEARVAALRYLRKVASDAGTDTRRLGALTTLWREWRSDPSTPRALQGLEAIALRSGSELHLPVPWRIRLAYLLARAGRRADAQRCLVRALEERQEPWENEIPELRERLSSLRDTFETIRSVDAPEAVEALGALRALVDRIEGIATHTPEPLSGPAAPDRASPLAAQGQTRWSSTQDDSTRRRGDRGRLRGEAERAPSTSASLR